MFKKLFKRTDEVIVEKSTTKFEPLNNKEVSSIIGGEGSRGKETFTAGDIDAHNSLAHEATHVLQQGGSN